MPPSFSLNFCLGDLDRLRLILENTLGLGLGLREHLDLCLFSCSLVLIVLDSEYCDVSEDPSKFSRDFTPFSFLAALDTGPPRSYETGSFLLLTMFRTADVGWLGADCSGLLMVSQILGVPSILLGPVDGPKWDPRQARVRL
ncbi:hypothetical protein Tco_0213326 [Tanacetum coccineum]